MKRNFALLALAAALVPPAFSLTLTGQTGGTQGSLYYTGDPNGSAYYPGNMGVFSMTPLAAGGTAAQKYADLLNQKFPPHDPYSLATAGTAAGGTLNVEQYGIQDLAPGIPDSCMATMVATYTPSPLEPNYVWLQIINTNVPGNGQTSPYIDIYAQSPQNGTPFYPNDPSGGGTMKFSDTPQRHKPGHDGDGHGYSTTWYADLFLCSFTPDPNGGMGGGIVIHDGVRWGFGLASFSLGKPGGGSTESFNPSVQAVPEPSTLLGLLPLMLVVLRRRSYCGINQ